MDLRVRVRVSSGLLGDRRSRLRSLERKFNIGLNSTSEETSEASDASTSSFRLSSEAAV